MSRYLEPEYADAFNAWKTTPTPETSNAMLTSLKPAIDRGIRAHAPGSDGPLIRGRAKVLALQSLQTYDPERSGIGTHIYNNFQGLRRINRQQMQPLKTPERVALEQGHLYDAEQELTDRLGRPPSDGELSDHMGLPRKRLAQIRGYVPVVPEGRLAQGGSAVLPGVLQDRKDFLFDLVYHDLDPVNQLILDHTIGRNGRRELSNQELAAKLRISPGAVSQRKSLIQQKLDQLEDLKAV